MTLKGKFALITGGGRGIGLGVTLALLEAGATVLIAQRQPLQGTLSQNPNVHFCQVDLLAKDASKTIAVYVEKHLGALDVVVNNAGIMFEQAVEDLDEEEWDRMMMINTRTPAFIVKALMPFLVASTSASIINMGSIEGIAANPNHLAYCTSKSAVHGLTKALAVDLGSKGIRCNAIAPGWIQSDLSNAYIGSQENEEKVMSELLRMHPVGRTGTPSDIGGVAVFLASEASSFVTGQILVVDGGRTSKLPLPF
ncbi:SDR family NAD(P)-dependent oxidoreductase [Rhodanobacter aciditrophus]|uniref:SDR family NAD(P)-dependent oxidoreductase n=1 Tax=Rhodanobacter aciditrophus TaxID=1623218 RepID=A0ABW4B2Y2_9GAMM